MPGIIILTVHCGGVALGAHRTAGPELDDDASTLVEIYAFTNDQRLRAALREQGWVLDMVIAEGSVHVQPFCGTCAAKMSITGAPRVPDVPQA